MNGLSPIIKEDILEELKDEDLPVLPYKSKNKNIFDIEERLNGKREKRLKNKNSLEEVINKDVIQIENKTNKDITRVKEPVKESVIQEEKFINENPIQESKSKGKELERGIEEKGKEKEKDNKPNFDLFNKEYNEMFPPLRPEDYN